MKVAFVHDVLPHYRVPLFNALSDALDGGLTVISERPPPGSFHLDATDELRATFVEGRRIIVGGVRFTPRVLRVALTARFDVIVLHWHGRHLEVLPVLLVSRFRRVPVLLYGHGLGRSSSRLVRLMRRAQLALSAGAILYAETGAAEVRALGGGVAVDVVDNTTGREPPSRHDVRDVPSHHLVFVGRLQERKRVDRLIDALAVLAGEGLDLGVTVVGDGPEREALQRRADEAGVGDRIEWVGPVTDWDELKAIVVESDLVVVPEAAGLAVVDAMACARPPVVFDGAGNGPEADIVTHGVNGLRYAPGSAAGLASCLRSAYEEPGLVERLSEQAGETYRERLTLDVAVGRFMAVLRRCRGRG